MVVVEADHFLLLGVDGSRPELVFLVGTIFLPVAGSATFLAFDEGADVDVMSKHQALQAANT